MYVAAKLLAAIVESRRAILAARQDQYDRVASLSTDAEAPYALEDVLVQLEQAKIDLAEAVLRQMRSPIQP